jgi:DeoR family transcriptional regulator of aga operon
MVKGLFQQERQDQIVILLEKTGRVSVIELGEHFGVSQATIRADLDTLASQNLLIRTHGGAIARDDKSRRNELELSFETRRDINPEQKARIGAAAAAMIQDGEAIVLDASTTTLSITDHIKGHRELTVLTNSILVTMALIDSPGVTVVMPGGFVRRDSASMVGKEGHAFIERFNFQRGFFGAKGFTLEEGLTDVNHAEVAIKKSFIERTKQVIAVVDSSKWGQVGFASFTSTNQVDCVITDKDAPADMVATLREAGVDVIIA